ncbi:hypothetical protein EBZ39_05820, partial [bacterium]|nr:hypothetical protein [bacterium]
YFALFSSTLLLVLLTIFFFRVFDAKTSAFTSAITDDLALIERALHQIDKTCNILSIRAGLAPIDFLTVERFSGSTIGCLNLAYPRRWKGPYAKTNPSMQGIAYQVVRTKEGYFVVPGDGVSLPNKLVMGKDIVLTYGSAITLMMQPGGRLNVQGHPLAIRLSFTIGDWDGVHPEKDTVERINDMIKEFNEAMPFAQRVAPIGIISC